MFLAWKEIKFNKGKFSLIMGLIVLITYLVYFLTSLAYGLASSYTNGINKVGADYIVLSTDGNDNVMMSRMGQADYDNVVTSGVKEKFGLFPAVIMNYNDPNMIDSKEEIYVFGIDNVNFFLPNESNLNSLADNEIIIDSSVKELGYEIGDEVSISGTDLRWTIVGFTNKATYQTAPIVYTSLNTWSDYRFSSNVSDIYNAILVKGTVDSVSDDLSIYTIGEYISTLPGYTAQVLTFSMMIGFLIIIIAFVLGIFVYVLTIQKVSMFGVMKAQGISNLYIGLSVIYQTFLIVLIGSLIGFGLTMLTGYFLSGIVPFATNYLFYGLITLGFFIFSILGGLFSVSTIVKIDPLKAIG